MNQTIDVPNPDPGEGWDAPAIKALIAAAEAVVAAWEDGDLAAAVRSLDAALEVINEVSD